MSNERAIELLVNATYSDEWQGNEELTTALHMAIDALEKQTKWISVKDRLPDIEQLHSDWVIGVVNGKYKNCTYEDAIQMVVYDEETNKWYLEECFDAEVNVSYWMPLPELP